MSLLDGLILHTFNQVNVVSQHSMLMRFYKLETEIEHWQETKSYNECFHSLEYHFMEVEARAILKALNIL